MAEVELTTLSLEELKSLQGRVARAIDTYEERRRREALSVVEAKAKEMGFSLGDLYAVSKQANTPRAAKFRHPENPDLTWSGRGRQPQWYKDAIEAGASPDDFLI
jgi:DNA-binding protein H-NS